MDESSGREINPWGIGITILLIFVASFFIELKAVKDWVEQAGAWGPIVFILLKISTIVVAPLSGSPLYPLVGIFFGFWEGLLYVTLGDFIGCTINFYLARRYGQNLVFKFISKKEEGIVGRAINHMSSVKGFFQAALALFAMPELVAYAAGLSRLSYSKFVSILTPINIFGAGVLVFMGVAIDSAQSSNFIKYILPLLGVAAFFLGGFLFAKAVRKR